MHRWAAAPLAQCFQPKFLRRYCATLCTGPVLHAERKGTNRVLISLPATVPRRNALLRSAKGHMRLFESRSRKSVRVAQCSAHFRGTQCCHFA